MSTVKNNTRGFTLIELLVVITIIGILATGATAVYTSQIQKARDTTRINDVMALQSGVEQSYQDTSEYPKQSVLQTELLKYLGKLPADPKEGQACNKDTQLTPPVCAYTYNVGKDNNSIGYGEYELSTAFENIGNVQKKAATDNGSSGMGLVRYEVGVDVKTNLTDLVFTANLPTGTKWVVKNDGSALVTTTEDTAATADWTALGTTVIINGN